MPLRARGWSVGLVVALAGWVPAPAAVAEARPAPPVVHDLPGVAAASTAAVDPGRRIETARTSRPVAPGVTLDSFDWYEPGDAGGWVRGDVLTADLTAGTTVGYLDPGRVSAAAPLSAQADAGRAVAAVNGDFFDINNSNAPEGVGIRDGELVKSPNRGHHRAVGVDAAGIGRVMEVFFEGAVATGDGTIPLTQLNASHIDVNGIGVFNPMWGEYSRARAVRGAARVTEVVVRGDVVAEVRAGAGADPIPADGYVLLGRDAGADTLAALVVGDRARVSYTSRTSDGSVPRTAIGGNQLLIRDGEIVAPPDPLHPRTAVGFSHDGTKMFLLTVDGRQGPYMLGLNLRDVASMLKEMGAHNALNLDGGGSSTMVAREPGAEGVRVENRPSDGAERLVPNGLALFAPAGSGELTGFWVRTAIEPARAPGADTVPGGHPDRVFPGLTRKLLANGYDETYGPARPGPRSWHVRGPHGRVDADGVFHAQRTGTAEVTVRRGGVTGRIALTVLGPLTRVTPTATRLSLVGQDDTATFGVVGYDDTGSTAPIEPSDVELDYDRGLLEVTPVADGGLRVRAVGAEGSGVITVRVGERVTRVAVTVGLRAQTFAAFDDAASWTFGSARGTGSVAPADGRTGPGLRLTYDFTKSTGTRTAYAIAPRPITIVGQPLALGAWVYGHGKGEWTAFTVTDGQGATRSLYGPYITWTGWKYMEIPVPAGMAFPLKVNRFYTIETKADRQYTGEVLIDDFVAKVPPPVAIPEDPAVTDTVVVQDGTVAGKQWRFAVMSDAQFVARNPDSDLVRAARRTLREIKAQRPDFLVVNGDFVDEAAPADLALARRVLTEELGDELPWYYVPGNHEIMGPGTIDNFAREFGATHRAFDHKGTRFVLLDSSTGTLRGGGFDQAVLLRQALDRAAADPVHSVVVLHHHPPRDPTPTKGSQLSDRREAAMVERWLADFRRDTGKGAAFIGAHVGVFHASRVDGVPYLINGNSGKAPSGDAGAGGFTGWTLVGVDPAAPDRAWPHRPRPPWLLAEMRPHVDSLTLRAPSVVGEGQSAPVDGVVVQGSRSVPVAYPVAHDWSGSPNLHIGHRRDLRPWHTAHLDPTTGTVTGLRPSTVVIAVTVNGVTQQTTIQIAQRMAA
ncbi:phosphodiester glycosidase family protein [Actinokineospora fastidiosa]|uniref:phosphodiester glycosidase family protein n=1 Tax=Actinokineospora fastidiosa TaxID=1816 RepID=UPI001E576D3E|nr:phosphodiester glycosidase family protein [Actinokineospora fastidiosa]